MKIKRIKNIRLVADKTYMCDVEVFFEKENMWRFIPYVAREEDDSQLNVLILKQMKSKKYKITDQRE
jgi:hypothetical protein